MTPAELLNRTADTLDSRPETDATFTSRMTVVLQSDTSSADVKPHIRAAARLMADGPPPGLADICAAYTGAEMLDRAQEFMTRRDGRTGAAAVAMNWMRAAAAGHTPEPDI